MSKWIWIKRFVLAFVFAGTVLFAVHLVKGYPAIDAAWFAALWGAIAAAIFTLVGYVKYRRNPACMLPRAKKP